MHPNPAPRRDAVRDAAGLHPRWVGVVRARAGGGGARALAHGARAPREARRRRAAALVEGRRVGRLRTPVNNFE